MKILTIDDSLTARMIIKRTFESEGHEILEAPDGAVGLSMLEEQAAIDVVILDWNMPVMNGLDCLVGIRKNPDFKNVKVIMCTTEAEKSQVMTAIKAGANGYVLKPVDPEKLKLAVTKACGANV